MMTQINNKGNIRTSIYSHQSFFFVFAIYSMHNFHYQNIIFLAISGTLAGRFASYLLIRDHDFAICGEVYSSEKLQFFK